MNLSRPLSIACLVIVLPHSANAGTIKVKPGGPHPTIASGIAAASVGDIVRIEAGTYQENVVVPGALTGLTLVAHGKVVIEARPAGGAPSGPGIDVQADGVTIDGIVVRNAATLDFDHPGVGIRVAANSFTARDVTTLRCNPAGIDVDGDNVLIERWSEIGSSDGLDLHDGQHAVVRDCRARQVNGAAIRISAYTDAVVEDCQFKLIESDAVSAGDATNSQIIARRNRVDQSADFAFRIAGDAAVVEDNTITDSNAGIIVRGNGFVVRRNTLRRTYGFTGILVDDSTSGTIEENDIRDVRAIGIDIRDNASATLVKNNVLRSVLEVDQPAIRIRGSNVELDGNEVRDCAGDGIVISGVANLVTNNVVEDCLRDGFDLESGANANTISACTARRCLAEGLDNSGSGQFIDNNTFEDCRIDVANDGSFSSFTGNTFATGGQSTPPEID